MRPLVARFLVGDVFERLQEVPDASVDVVVTSPPFLALRSYLPPGHPDKAKEIGSDPDPGAFLDTLLALTAEWRRVLAPHGSICVELGDTYAGSGGAGGDYSEGGFREGQQVFSGSANKRRRHGVEDGGRPPRGPRGGWPLDKSLCGIPSLYAWSLAYGRNLLNPCHEVEPWRIRNLIAWTRPNPPVGALGDKVRPGTSYVTTACVGRRRYFDLDGERVPFTGNPGYGTGIRKGQNGDQDHDNRPDDIPHRLNTHDGAPLLDWWAIPTQPYKGSHYATFPEELPRRLISLMCPPKVCVECGAPSERIVAVKHAANRSTNGPQAIERMHLDGGSSGFAVRTDRVASTVGWTDCGHEAWRRGVVLDPFVGSGTTLAVATAMGRDAIGIDLDARNVGLAHERVGLFLEVDG